MRRVFDMREELENIPGYLHDTEGMALYLFSKYSRGDIIEIGSFHGRSTTWIGRGLKERGTGKIYSIDPHMGITDKEFKGVDCPEERQRHKIEFNVEDPTAQSYEGFLETLKKYKIKDIVEIIRKTSEKAKEDLPSGLTASLIFVDGDHTYEGVKKDIELYLPMLGEDGVIAFHDFNQTFQGVFKAVTELISTGEYNTLQFNSLVLLTKNKSTKNK